ncbi:methylenetetrahydrofolate reductase-like isoform X2 [Drosophila albomicans]|uniref:Methylenetetrahydrofolate reductase-like isoform X2 n=1 Tax=Drosophila albomicans TaxID=7291 RepID=A0A9C6T677_DROAB|nr:methylenetetrahydrofolate reductase-like isoform X2 [Drosophila albomicans]
MCFNLSRILSHTTFLRSMRTIKRNQYHSHCKYHWMFAKRLCSSEANASAIKPYFEFTDDQKEHCLNDPNIAEIVKEKSKRKEFFYGIEIPLKMDLNTCLDFKMFLPQMPEFMSIVWTKQFSDAIRSASMAKLPNIQTHLNDFLDLNLNNVLVIRGDHVEEGQEYNYAYEAVKYLRAARGNRLAIAVAGYPEGYTNLQVGPRNKALDIEYLKLKIDIGANLIITQLCYSAEKIIELIKDARIAGITVPILVGIIVPYSFSNYQIIERITGVRLSPEARIEVEQLSSDDTKVKDYFVQLMVRIIQQILEADLGIYGIQFFTLNHFEPVVEVLRELRSKGIPKNSKADC